MASYPKKVERVLAAVRAVDWRPWQDVTVESYPSGHGALYSITAERPGNVFTRERLRLSVSLRTPYTIDGTDIRMRRAERFMGGEIMRFGSDVPISSWGDLKWKLR